MVIKKIEYAGLHHCLRLSNGQIETVVNHRRLINGELTRD